MQSIRWAIEHPCFFSLLKSKLSKLFLKRVTRENKLTRLPPLKAKYTEIIDLCAQKLVPSNKLVSSTQSPIIIASYSGCVQCHPLDVHVSIAAQRPPPELMAPFVNSNERPERRVEGTFDQPLDVGRRKRNRRVGVNPRASILTNDLANIP